MVMQLLISSLGLRSHGIGRILLLSLGPTLTARKFRRLAAQISVWTNRKYWTVPCEQSVLLNFSASRNSSETVWTQQWCGTKHSANSFTHQFTCAVLKLLYHHLHDHISHNRCWREFVFTVKQSQGNKVIGECHRERRRDVADIATIPFEHAARQKKCEIKRLTREDADDFVRR